MAQVRPYRGVDAAERLAGRRRQLLDAGLQLLGASEDPAELTVRAICGRAGVSARYFYESFTDKDQLVAAVFDHVVADIAATTQAAVAAAPRDEQNRAGMANIVRTIASDTRIGRLLFSSQLSNAVVAAKRAESGVLLATLYGREMGTALHVAGTSQKGMATAHFAVGGVGQTISAWLAGDVDLHPDELIDQLAAILDAVTDPRLHG